jgi:hypothetical protein
VTSVGVIIQNMCSAVKGKSVHWLQTSKTEAEGRLVEGGALDLCMWPHPRPVSIRVLLEDGGGSRTVAAGMERGARGQGIAAPI